MLLLPLLLCAAVCRGYAYRDFNDKDYGSTYRIRLSSRAHSLKFIPANSSPERILWSRDDPSVTVDRRHQVTGSYYVLQKLTQRDNGQYITIDKNQRELYTKEISVREKEINLDLSEGEYFEGSSDLEESACNIYFFPESDNGEDLMMLVRHGHIKDYHRYCAETRVTWPCGIRNDGASASCNGRFEFIDFYGNKALVMNIKVEHTPSYFDPTILLISIGVIGGTITCCCCVRCCCCKKKSKSEVSDSPDDSPDAAPAAAEPAVQYHRYDYEPVTLTATHINQDPTRGSSDYAPTSPKIHNPTPVNLNEPPAYSEVSAPAAQADSVTLPLTSDPDPQFELKGVIFPSAPPLSSESPYCDVYTSDKLNFL